MSRFYVTQPVRIVRDCWGHGRNAIGKEGRVTANNLSDPDGFIYRISGQLGLRFHADELEPILPEGLESLEETLALWQPEGIAA